MGFAYREEVAPFRAIRAPEAVEASDGSRGRAEKILVEDTTGSGVEATSVDRIRRSRAPIRAAPAYLREFLLHVRVGVTARSSERNSSEFKARGKVSAESGRYVWRTVRSGGSSPKLDSPKNSETKTAGEGFSSRTRDEISSGA